MKKIITIFALVIGFYAHGGTVSKGYSTNSFKIPECRSTTFGLFYFMETKACKYCKSTKAKSDFYKSGQGFYSSNCKDCSRFLSKEKRVKNIDVSNPPIEIVSLDGEVWKDVVGWEGLYQVSNLGRVKSFDRYINNSHGTKTLKRGRVLYLAIHGTGYLGVGLSKDGLTTIITVHALLAQAFIANPENKPQVNHINGIRADNRLENLEWVTCSENIQHSYDVLGRKTKTEKIVIQYLKTGEIVKEFKSVTEAALELGKHKAQISCVCRRGSGFGFNWGYKNNI